MTTLLIVSITLILISCILLFQARKIKVQRTNQIHEIEQQINKNEQALSELKSQIKTYQVSIKDRKNHLNTLHEECNKINNELQQKQNHLNDYYENLKKQTNQSFEQYSNTIDKCYETKEREFELKIQQIKEERESVENQLSQIKTVYEAATAARIREKEDQTKRMFYQLQIPKTQISDMTKLEEWKRELNDPSIVSKIIWSSYVIKPASDLCNRVLGTSAVCGIYKITNILTGDIYIGQSVNIADRWKNHIKCGLGIDASSTNKLYNNMQEYGVQNFTFEILQKCSRDKLNEKERFWIEMYQSNKVGLNVTKGNK